ncbi:unnamed protein product [Owenia fusiformis]|uniref:Uncharacterized protein n=1 Tax=Owenia fusiformis TaxID=6347 RepID=A0A8S4Q1E4_OWEFU|nr:unnamed protein product [Owenia fusiformis]
MANNLRIYGANIILISTSPTFRVIYVSGPIKVSPKILHRIKIKRRELVDDPFIFPCSVIVEDLDNLAIGVNVNDMASVVIRITGIKEMLDRVIKIDKENGTKKGPTPGSVQESVFHLMEKVTGQNFHS